MTEWDNQSSLNEKCKRCVIFWKGTGWQILTRTPGNFDSRISIFFSLKWINKIYAFSNLGWRRARRRTPANIRRTVASSFLTKFCPARRPVRRAGQNSTGDCPAPASCTAGQYFIRNILTNVRRCRRRRQTKNIFNILPGVISTGDNF